MLHAAKATKKKEQVKKRMLEDFPDRMTQKDTPANRVTKGHKDKAVSQQPEKHGNIGDHLVRMAWGHKEQGNDQLPCRCKSLSPSKLRRRSGCNPPDSWEDNPAARCHMIYIYIYMPFNRLERRCDDQLNKYRGLISNCAHF